MPDFIKSIEESARVILDLSLIAQDVKSAADMMLKSINDGGKIFWFGNGGSAADAQHFAAELMVRFKRNRRPIASIALNTDTSLLTAHSNDFGYETVFARQIEALATEKDVVIGMSTSGKSENIRLALETAKSKGIKTIGLLGGDGGTIRSLCSIALTPNSSTTAHVQEAHLVVGHYLCETIEHFLSI
ncbi:SIS domain-containing protein [Pelagicoccus enzymogenes]|uniref:D-sedoheptulose-7-phosphate isomerase n=1 Tax=Pelagicoccus enzymogenes TaxID=2773457 RepID=UPI00280FC801|nr:SIS domain-containing protein [Pelagicoccus enzymogenes]MDQ8199773.1 SIS domain-containing protein [Pelagicoccus enzymogenes]